MDKILILVIILFISLIIGLYVKDLMSARNKNKKYQTKVFDSEIAPIEYYRLGKGAPILILHGITGGYDQGIGQAEMYIGDGYDIIAVSRFGYLNSPLPDNSTPEAQAELYKYLLDNLKIKKAFVYGNSAGGTSAFKFAIKYPERCSGLIMLSSNVPSRDTPKLPPKPIAKIIFGFNFAYWAIVKILGTNMLAMTGIPKQILNKLSKKDKKELLNGIIMSCFPIKERTKGIINDMFLSNPDINNNYPFDQIKVPTIMISAEDDTLCPNNDAKRVCKIIPKAKFINYKDGGHLLLNHEKEIRKVIATFIRDNTN